MAWTEAAKNAMLDGQTVNLLSLHTGNPGAAGTDFEVSGGGYARVAATFDAASGGERLLNASVQFAGPPAGAVAYVGFWNSTGPVFKGSAAINGDSSFNADGEYIVSSPGTKLAIEDA